MRHFRKLQNPLHPQHQYNMWPTVEVVECCNCSAMNLNYMNDGRIQNRTLQGARDTNKSTKNITSKNIGGIFGGWTGTSLRWRDTFINNRGIITESSMHLEDSILQVSRLPKRCIFKLIINTAESTFNTVHLSQTTCNLSPTVKLSDHPKPHNCLFLTGAVTACRNNIVLFRYIHHNASLTPGRYSMTNQWECLDEEETSTEGFKTILLLTPLE